MNTQRLASTVTAAVAAMILTAGYAPAAAPVCGDVNDSGKVTSSDALLVLQESVHLPVDLVCGPAGGTLKTGQTTCYDADAQIDCAGTGQDGELQKGVARSFTDNGDGTVTDNVTGLMWEKLSDDDTIHDKDTSYTWVNAFASKITTLNSESFAGYDDWRVPNRFELETLLSLASGNLATYSAFDTGCVAMCTVTACSCTQPDYYWSSSTSQYQSAEAWYVDFDVGGTNVRLKTSNYFVRAVRAGS